MTSHDVVNRLRRLLGQKKIGHTGTLDPDAEGVLPVCLGSGTRLCEYFTDDGKEYRAVLLLGVVTDTQDLTGTVLEEREVHVSEEEVRRAAASFTGQYEQIPPMYSAIKKNGRKLYELARAGIEVERAGRMVTIEHIACEKIAIPEVQLLVSCSKGTYIRTLCEDIGRVLGCGGCMKSLVRTKAGLFSAEDALTLQEVEKHVGDGDIEACILPVDWFFKNAAGARLEPPQDIRLRNGNPFPARQMKFLEGDSSAKEVRMYDSTGTFVGLYRYHPSSQVYKPVKMFLPL